ncbi:hypothetical protein NE237_029339 [Protea cynaroides]|uniref:Uncharacterized protein n=1 Tax=Protea cynaroides TaxID=273540 RepID=A0A9Q0GR12_9MAGN|nr:hypothetical protein NE237_029339 [Protea cynaroides]
MLNDNKPVATRSLSLATFLCWQIWLAKNDDRIQRKKWNPMDVINKAVIEFDEFAAVQWPSVIQNNILQSLSVTDRILSQRASAEFVICMDTSLSSDSSLGGLGIAFFDLSSGLLYKALSSKCQFQHAIQGEALAIWTALLKTTRGK